MSGNAKQRKQLRDHRELVELGRQQRAALDGHAAEIAALRDCHAAELASLRAGYERELAEVQQRYQGEVESWARSARADAELVAKLRTDLQAEQRRREQLQIELDEIKRGGLITRREHEAAVATETARLRERLRRRSEERLAPKTVVLEKLAAGAAQPAASEEQS